MPTGIDPLDGLLALGVITREQLVESERVDPDIATTTVGRLVCIGVNAPDLLGALSSLTGIPLAAPGQLDNAQPVELSPALQRALRDVPAAPLGRGADGVLDIAIAEPQAAHRLAALGVQRHRLFLALEIHVRDVIERLMPDDATDAAQPLDSAFDGIEGVVAPPAAPRPSSQPPQRASASTPPSQLLSQSAPLPNPFASLGPADAPPPAFRDAQPLVLDLGAPGLPAAADAPFERAKPVREKYAPGARPTNGIAPKIETTPRPQPSPPPPSPAPSLDLTLPSGPPLATAKPPAKAKAAPPPEQKRSAAGLVLVAVLVVVAVVGGVLYGPQLKAFVSPAPEDPLVTQKRFLDQARKQAATGNNQTDAIILCDKVIMLNPGGPLANEAQWLKLEQNALLEDPVALADLKAKIASAEPSDPLVKEAQAVVAKLDKSPSSSSTKPDANPDDAAKKPAVKPAVKAKGEPDLDSDVGAGKRTRPAPAPAPGPDDG